MNQTLKSEMVAVIKSHGYEYADMGGAIVLIHNDYKVTCATKEQLLTAIRYLTMGNKLALLRALGYSHADFARRAGVTQAALAYPSPRLDAAADRWLQEILGETTGRERAEALVGLVNAYTGVECG